MPLVAIFVGLSLLAGCISFTQSTPPAPPLVLGPEQRFLTIKAPITTPLPHGRVQLTAPGQIYLQDLPVTAAAWLAQNAAGDNPLDLHAQPPPHFSVDQLNRYWYLFIDTPTPITTPFQLVFKPAWHSLETTYKTLEDHLQQTPVDTTALYQRAEAAVEALDNEYAPYAYWTTDLSQTLRHLHRQTLLDQAHYLARRYDYQAAQALLERVQPTPPDLPPPTPIQRDQIETIRNLIAQGRFFVQLRSVDIHDLDAACRDPNQLLPLSLDPLCRGLELIAAQTDLDQAEAALARGDYRAKIILASARSRLERHDPKPLDPAQWEEIQQILADAQRVDLLAAAVALSKPQLFTRLRDLDIRVDQLELEIAALPVAEPQPVALTEPEAQPIIHSGPEPQPVAHPTAGAQPHNQATPIPGTLSEPAKAPVKPTPQVRQDTTKIHSHIRQARYLRDQAELDLDRKYEAQALEKINQALALVAPYPTDPSAREIHNYLSLKLRHLKNRYLALVHLDTRLVPLAQCLEAHQILPRQLPFTLLIREGLIALPQTQDSDYVHSYDIELVIPKEEAEKLTLEPRTADKDQPIPVEITDLLDGRVSYVIKTTALPAPPRIQITFSGGRIDLRKIAQKWFIHKGIAL